MHKTDLKRVKIGFSASKTYKLCIIGSPVSAQRLLCTAGRVGCGKMSMPQESQLARTDA